jgi:hypothetical protein
MSENTDYSKLRLDVLQKMIYQRGIDCKMKKDEMVKMLKLYDEGKYEEPMKETTYEKSEGGFNVGIDLRNHSDLVQMGKFIEKKEAKSLNRYSDNKMWYWSKGKLI